VLHIAAYGFDDVRYDEVRHGFCKCSNQGRNVHRCPLPFYARWWREGRAWVGRGQAGSGRGTVGPVWILRLGVCAGRVGGLGESMSGGSGCSKGRRPGGRCRGGPAWDRRKLVCSNRGLWCHLAPPVPKTSSGVRPVVWNSGFSLKRCLALIP
jgi:hypothetical protein